jgi:4-hydroxy-tetrahydrodipicolinate reductase
MAQTEQKKIRVVVAGVSGWVGRELVQAIAASDDLVLTGAVARGVSGQDAGTLAGLPKPLGVPVHISAQEALAAGADVLVDYTKPQAVRAHVSAALDAGVAVVIGTSGLTADDYFEIDSMARARSLGVAAAGNFSVTAMLLKRFSLMAAQYVGDIEIIDYAGPQKPDVPSGTARELAEALENAREHPPTAKPVADILGPKEARGAQIGTVPVHSVRLPPYILSCEAQFGLPGERLTIRHDAGASAAPYVAGTLLAVRKVGKFIGLRRGLDGILDA